jgi:hypothetical protein
MGAPPSLLYAAEYPDEGIALGSFLCEVA